MFCSLFGLFGCCFNGKPISSLHGTVLALGVARWWRCSLMTPPSLIWTIKQAKTRLNVVKPKREVWWHTTRSFLFRARAGAWIFDLIVLSGSCWRRWTSGCWSSAARLLADCFGHYWNELFTTVWVDQPQNWTLPSTLFIICNHTLLIKSGPSNWRWRSLFNTQDGLASRLICHSRDKWIDGCTEA